jgi:hypothetical protein
MNKQHVVRLTGEVRDALRAKVKQGDGSRHELQRARILLQTDAGVNGPRLTDRAVAAAVEASPRTVARVRADWAAGGLKQALERRTSPRVYRRKLDGTGEAHLLALATSTPPVGADRWTLRLLAEGLIEADVVETIALETVRLTLKKTNSNRGSDAHG